MNLLPNRLEEKKMKTRFSLCLLFVVSLLVSQAFAHVAIFPGEAVSGPDTTPSWSGLPPRMAGPRSS